MRDYKKELENRIAFIQKLLKDSGAKGIVFGNSGGKDSALVGILCKMACENTVGIIMPCESARNFGEDKDDGIDVAAQFNIDTRTVDLTDAKRAIVAAVVAAIGLTGGVAIVVIVVVCLIIGLIIALFCPEDTILEWIAKEINKTIHSSVFQEVARTSFV